jgi:hypothetical protein
MPRHIFFTPNSQSFSSSTFPKGYDEWHNNTKYFVYMEIENIIEAKYYQLIMKTRNIMVVI